MSRKQSSSPEECILAVHNFFEKFVISLYGSTDLGVELTCNYVMQCNATKMQLQLNSLQGEGEDLFGDAMERDYQPIPELDTYEEDLIDREEYASMSPGAR